MMTLKVGWKWQSLDSVSIKAPLGGDLTDPNPTDRSKSGTKRHVLTDQRGIPVSVVITSANTRDMKAANTRDMKAAKDTLDSVITQRPLK